MARAVRGPLRRLMGLMKAPIIVRSVGLWLSGGKPSQPACVHDGVFRIAQILTSGNLR
jgi:hypothetical protein